MTDRPAWGSEYTRLRAVERQRVEPSPSATRTAVEFCGGLVRDFLTGFLIAVGALAAVWAWHYFELPQFGFAVLQ